MHSEGNFFVRHDDIIVLRMWCYLRTQESVEYMFQTRLVINYNHMQQFSTILSLKPILTPYHAYFIYVGSV